MNKNEYVEFCYAAKGRFVDKVSLLEYQLSLIINHIMKKFDIPGVVPDNLYKIHVKILAKKIKKVEKLMQEHYSDLLKQNDTIFVKLEQIKDFRNAFTHSLLEVSKMNYRYAEGTPTVYTISIKSGYSTTLVSHIPFENIENNIIVIDEVCEFFGNFLINEFSDYSL